MKAFAQDGPQPQPPTHGARYALLIGINKYPLMGDVNLDGSVSDALGYKALLEDRYSFPPAHITTLLDEQATRDAILSACDRLVQVASAGDQVVIAYSGHGRRVADPDGVEADHMHETFVPSDSGSGFYPNRDIRDDELLARIVALTDKGALVTFFCDCCHSSASLRDDFSASIRGVASDVRRTASTATPDQPADIPSESERRGVSGPTLRRDRYVYVAACRDNELATEHIQQSDAGPITHGALSFYLQRELLQCRSDEPMRAIVDRAFAQLTAECPQQHPRAEGALSLPPLFVPDAGAERHSQITVRERVGDTVILSVGRLHGETLGSRYLLFPPAPPASYADSPTHDDAHDPDDGHDHSHDNDAQATIGPTLAALAEAEVTAVRATTVTARIVHEATPGSVVVGSVALEAEHAQGSLALRVQLAPEPRFATELSNLQQQLAHVPMIEETTAARASLRVYALPSRDRLLQTPGQGDSAAPMPQLGSLDEACWAIVGRDGQLRSPPLPLSPADDGGAVRRVLTTLATYQIVLGMDRPNSALRGQVTATLRRCPDRAPTDTWEPPADSAEGLPLCNEGDALALDLTLRADAPRPLYVAVLYLSASGEVDLWAALPPSRARLIPGSKWQLGLAQSELRRLSIAPGFPPIGWERPAPFPALGPLAGDSPDDIEPPTVQDVIKIFVGTAPLQAGFAVALRRADELRDSSTKLTNPSATTGPSPRGLPARLLAAALAGKRRVRRSDRPEEWTTLSVPLVVRRRMG